jgi:sarcosine oxidase gamma subunit
MRTVIRRAAAAAGYDLLAARSFAVALWRRPEEAAAEFTAIERERQE